MNYSFFCRFFFVFCFFVFLFFFFFFFSQEINLTKDNINGISGYGKLRAEVTLRSREREKKRYLRVHV